MSLAGFFLFCDMHLLFSFSDIYFLAKYSKPVQAGAVSLALSNSSPLSQE